MYQASRLFEERDYARAMAAFARAAQADPTNPGIYWALEPAMRLAEEEERAEGNRLFGEEDFAGALRRCVA